VTIARHWGNFGGLSEIGELVLGAPFAGTRHETFDGLLREVPLLRSGIAQFAMHLRPRSNLDIFWQSEAQY
jgi:hypothetical protein